MGMRHRWTVLAAAVVTVGVLCGCDRGPNFALKLKQGETRVVEMESDENVNMQVMGQSMDIIGTRTAHLRLHIDEVRPDDSARVTATWVKLGNDTSQSFAGMSLSRLGLPDGLMEQIEKSKPKLSVAEGTSFTFDLLPDGTVQNVQGTEKVVDAVTAAMTDAPVDAVIAARRGLESELGNEGMARRLSDTLALNPKKKANAGDSWTENETTPGQLPLQTTETYTVRQVQGDTILLDVTGTLAAQPGAAMELPIGNLQMTLNGQATGTVEVHEPSGWVRSIDAQITGSGQAGIDLMGQKLSIPMTLKGRERVNIRPE